MKVFVTGACGQLGTDLMAALIARGHEAVGSDVGEACEKAGYVSLDITDASAVSDALARTMPDAVIHLAAWTAVDAAEDEANREKVMRINADGTRNIAAACRDLGIRMMYISTDYVFSGDGETPWKPDCEDFRPLNVYGLSKLRGEEAVRALLKEYFIVRIAWVFGVHGKNFVRTMLNLAETHDTLRVVDDQIGTPTFTPHLSRLLCDMIETDRFGIYHATNEGGYISWCRFAQEIFRLAGKNVKVLPVTTAEYGVSKAARPFNSRLDKSKLVEAGFAPLPPWQDALTEYLELSGAIHGTD